MNLYRSPFRYDGYAYEVALPGGWSSHMYSADNEKNYLVHENPTGSMLYIETYQDMGISARVRVPDEITDAMQRSLYAKAAVDESYLSATNFLVSELRYFLFGIGRRAKVKAERIGKLKGFTFLVNRRGVRWWCAYFACEQRVVHTRYVMAAADDYDQGISVVHEILESFRLVKRGPPST